MTEEPSAATQPEQNDEDTRGQPEPPGESAEEKPVTETEAESQPPKEDPGDEPDESDEETAEVFNFPARKSRRGRPTKSAADSYRVSVEKVSLNTYAVRIRWKREDGSDHPGVVINRLNDAIVKEIKRSKNRYEQFKSQTLSSWQSRAVRQGDQSRTNPRRAV